MKGLLLKDLYQIWKYCRSYVVICLVFLGISLFGSEEQSFFVIYPCLLCGMIPVNLISYDAGSRWEITSLTLPYSRAQLVSAKYLIGLICQMGILILTVLFQGVGMYTKGNLEMAALAELGATLYSVAMLLPALMLPLIFKLGVEKGRIFYLCGIGALMAVSGIVITQFTETGAFFMISPMVQMIGLPLVATVLYVLSWLLSIRFYQKRQF